MANEFTPELNDQVYQAILRKIQQQQAQQIAAAQGDAATRGLSGSTYEASLIGSANRGATQSSADALTQLAIENATRLREERMIREQEGYQSGEAEKGRTFEAAQGALGREFQGSEADKQRAFEEAQARREGRQGLLNTGLGGLANAGGQIGAGLLFHSAAGGAGTGAAAGSGMLGLGGGGTGLTGAAGLPVGSTLGGGGVGAGGGIGSFLAPAAGITAGALGGGYTGQKLGNSIFKSKAAESRARKGASIGAGIGTAAGTAFGPLGSALGGVAGGVIGQGIGGLTKSHAAHEISATFKKPSRIFCFDPDTLVEMADGSTKPINRVELGEETKGGKVVSIRTSLTDDGTVYRYKGVTVTGSHAVKENGKWIRVEKSMWAIPVDGSQTVVSLVTEKHRIFAKGVEFADEHETNDHESLSIDESLDALNRQETAVAV